MTIVRVTVFIVAYEAGAMLERCVEAVLRSAYRPFEVIVVDNGSRDGAAKQLAEWSDPRLHVMSLTSNAGFAGAVVAGIAYLEGRSGWVPGDVYALVNQDCFVDPGWLGPLVAVLTDNERVAVVGGRLYDGDRRTLQHAGGMIFPNGLTEHVGRGSVDEEAFRQPAEVDYVTGAMCAFRADTWAALGGFDRGYHPAYFEEADFCVRARERGMRVLYEPESMGVHLEATSTTRGSREFLRFYHRGRMRFVVRHLLRRGRWVDAIRAELKWLVANRGRTMSGPLLAAYLRLPRELTEALFARGDGQRPVGGTSRHFLPFAPSWERGRSSDEADVR